jgi:hypothetical protein
MGGLPTLREAIFPLNVWQAPLAGLTLYKTAGVSLSRLTRDLPRSCEVWTHSAQAC